MQLLGGRYELGPAIGSGGFGTVFRAVDRHSGAEVAVKLVAPGLGSDGAAERLRREGEVLREVRSRRVAQVHDFGADEHGTWLVSELVDGGPLERATLGRALLPHEVLRVARGLLEALAAIHAAGVVHGDVKPSNVLVSAKALDAVKLVDFGLARVGARTEIAASTGTDVPTGGVVLGTVRWMAPEVLAGGQPTVRSDLYAAGLVLFELLDVGPLFPVGAGAPQLQARLFDDPELAPRVPEPLADVLGRMLARDPSERWRDAAEAHAAVVDLDTAPVSVVAASGLQRASARLGSLPADGALALRDTLRHLDVAMLDALARRERGSAMGRIARALALALRLEVDAAALVLEPLASQSVVARAIGATVLAPRAKRVTRARVDADRDDRWLDGLDEELGAMLVSLATALSTGDDAERDVGRCARAIARLEALASSERRSSERDVTRTTLRTAQAAARVRRGELERGVARDLVAPLVASRVDASRVAPFHVVVRALCMAALADEAAADAALDLERAERAAADAGATLLAVSATVALGGLFASTRNDRLLPALERASTLLANGDLPTLEHEAEHRRGAALLARGQWQEAIASLRASRAVARAERVSSAETRSASLEVIALLACGDRAAAFEAAALLGDARLAALRGRQAALGWVARALVSLSAADGDGAEDALAEAEAHVRQPDRGVADVYVLVEVVGILFDVARGALPDLAVPAGALERFAAEHGVDVLHWTFLLRAVIERLADGDAIDKMTRVLRALEPALGARNRPTDAPPSAAVP